MWLTRFFFLVIIKFVLTVYSTGEDERLVQNKRVFLMELGHWNRHTLLYLQEFDRKNSCYSSTLVVFTLQMGVVKFVPYTMESPSINTSQYRPIVVSLLVPLMYRCRWGELISKIPNSLLMMRNIRRKCLRQHIKTVI